jgi:hypothetical protein
MADISSVSSPPPETRRKKQTNKMISNDYQKILVVPAWQWLATLPWQGCFWK